MLAICFAIEGTLIFFHLGTPELSTQSHMFMVIIVYTTVGAIIGEILFPNNILLSLVRGAAIIFQGLWWHIVGTILYGGAYSLIAKFSIKSASSLFLYI